MSAGSRDGESAPIRYAYFTHDSSKPNHVSDQSSTFYYIRFSLKYFTVIHNEKY